MKLTAQLHQVPQLTRGAILSFPYYVFMVWCLLKQGIHIHGVGVS